MYFPTSHIENHCKHSHVPNFPRTIFKCGKDIHCPKISDMFDYGGSALLDMCIVDCLMSLSVLAFLDSFLTLGLFGWRVVIINCVCPSVRLSVPIYLVNTITQSVYPMNPPYFGLLQLSPGFYYNYNLPPLLMILIIGAFPGPDSCRVCHPQMAIFFFFLASMWWTVTVSSDAPLFWHQCHDLNCFQFYCIRIQSNHKYYI